MSIFTGARRKGVEAMRRLRIKPVITSWRKGGKSIAALAARERSWRKFDSVGFIGTGLVSDFLGRPLFWGKEQRVWWGWLVGEFIN